LEPLKANISNKFFPNFKNSMDNLIRSSLTETDKQNTALFQRIHFYSRSLATLANSLLTPCLRVT
jgi:hypothetical protein